MIIVCVCFVFSSGMSSFFSELTKGLGAGGRLWELLERKPELPFNGGFYSISALIVFTAPSSTENIKG